MFQAGLQRVLLNDPWTEQRMKHSETHLLTDCYAQGAHYFHSIFTSLVHARSYIHEKLLKCLLLC